MVGCQDNSWYDEIKMKKWINQIYKTNIINNPQKYNNKTIFVIDYAMLYMT